MIEIWKDILGYEGLYKASNLGRIKSMGNEKFRKDKILKQNLAGGYLKVGLYKCGVCKKLLVHRLVWEAFNGKIPDGIQVNHIDENPFNNELSNINLMTPKDNINWGTRNERAGIEIKKHKLKSIIQCDLNGNIVKVWPVIEVQKLLGIYQEYYLRYK